MLGEIRLHDELNDEPADRCIDYLFDETNNAPTTSWSGFTKAINCPAGTKGRLVFSYVSIASSPSSPIIMTYPPRTV